MHYESAKFRDVLSPLAELVPSRKQWKVWSLPSKLTAIGTLVSIIGLVITFGTSLNSDPMGPVEREIRASEGRILGSLDRDRQFAEALHAFETKDYEKAAILLDRLFAGSNRRPPDELQGYVVASYYGASDYAQAAREVLQRDRRRSANDYRLWTDLARCIRSHAREKSLPAALALLDSLKDEYGRKLLSRSWAVLPLLITDSLEAGKHVGYLDLPEEVQKDIRYVIDHNPQDPYIEFAYYAIGDYEGALKNERSRLIHDVILYAVGRASLDMAAAFGTDTAKARLYEDRAQERFLNYVQFHPAGPYAQIAMLDIARIDVQRGNLQAGLARMREATRLGPPSERAKFELGVISEFPLDSLVSILHRDRTLVAREELWGHVISSLINKNNYRAVTAIAPTAINDILLSWGDLKPIQREAPCLGIREREHDPKIEFHRWDATSWICKAWEKARFVENASVVRHPSEIKNAANLLRRGGHYRESAYVLWRGLQRFGTWTEADKLAYLRVLAFREWQPDSVKQVAVWMVEHYPTSQYADDALAESAFVYAMIRASPDSAYQMATRIRREYPNGNALDNALNWAARGYRNRREFGRATQVYAELVSLFPRSRLGSVGRSELRKCQRSNTECEIS
jgi:hypothetical protein